MALAYYDDEEAKVSKLFENTFGKLIGLGLVALAIVFMAMFLTYSVEDPSPMNVTKSSPTNALGGLGAYLADPLIQMLGRAVWIIPTVLFAWAIRRYFAIGTASIMNRILFLPLALVIASVFFATNSVSAPGHLRESAWAVSLVTNCCEF